MYGKRKRENNVMKEGGVLRWPGSAEVTELVNTSEEGRRMEKEGGGLCRLGPNLWRLSSGISLAVSMRTYNERV